MRFANLLGVCYFLMYHSLSAVQIEDETIAPRKRPTLVSLNLDCQLLIFEHLNMIDLFSMAEADTRLSFAVEDFLRPKFAKKPLKFVSPYNNCNENIPRNSAWEYSNAIEMNSLPTITQFLGKFAHLISNLTFKQDDRFTDAEAEKVFKLVNLHCSKTLSHLHVSGRKFPFFLSFFGVIERPFEAVESLILENRISVLSGVNLTFGEIFPRIENLTLNRFECPNFLDEHYPHLKHLRAQVSSTYGVMHQFTFSIFKTFIAKNSQIKSLDLQHVEPGLLDYIANVVPTLERLTLKGYSLNCDKNNYNTHFKHLKRLEVFESWGALSSNISFGILEEYVTDSLPYERMRPHGRTCCLEVIKTTKSLKKIRLIRSFNNNDIIRLAEAKPSAVEIELYYTPDVEVDSLVKLMQESENLTKLHLISKEETFSKIDALVKQFSNGWIINVFANGRQIHMDKMDRK